MPAIPIQGANSGTWGTDLNAFLEVEHEGTDGTHKAITATSITSSGTVSAPLVSGVAYNIVCNGNQVVCNDNQVVIND